MNLPPDFGGIESELFNLLADGVFRPDTSSYIYQQIQDPINKFIACFVFEAGNTQKEAEIATGLSKATIWRRINEIREQITPYVKQNRLIS